MRLETISLKNFGPYRDVDIDLRNVAAAVITGSNGCGKSTGFVDGPLAAFFGKCRVSLDDILSIGADDMVLDITFRLNGQRYRVIRKRSKKTKAGKSELALQIANGDEWEDISGARLTETQDKICALLNADYELLTATGIIVQGQADRFSRATPAERKAILSQILRLEQYGHLKQAASRHATIADTKVNEKRTALIETQNEADHLPMLEGTQREVAGALDESRKAIAQLETHQQELTVKQGTYSAQLAQLSGLSDELTKLRSQLSQLLGSKQSLQDRRTRASKILGKRDEIEVMITKEATLVQQLRDSIEQVRQKRTEIDAVQVDINGLTATIAQGVTLEHAVDKARTVLSNLKAHYLSATQDLEKEIAREEQQVKLLTVVPCDQGLQQKCQFTLTAVTVQSGLPAKRRALEDRKTADNLFFVEETDYQAAMNDHEAWKQQKWPDVLETHIQRKKALQQDATALQSTIQTLETQLAEARKYSALKPELDAADREVAQVDQDIQRTATDIDGVTDKIVDTEKRLQAKAAIQSDLEDTVSSLKQDQIYLARLRTDGETAIGRLKELEVEIKSAQEAVRQVGVLQRELDLIGIDGQHFQTLTVAYSKIPVLIMETAIPLLEDEANRILGKISASGMRVRLDTQKALKSRDGLAETLDIIVRDIHGERPYEAFSGGERARIDLALRIGLSKLIANRAGSRISTLIVDEAFAAVDQEGVESLVECLPMLTDEFGLILFVTHDENFKSAVAQRIVVSKSPNGSSVEVLA